ncbi:MAG: aconitase X catalytic domain-containing protein [Candidatus Diapherotrites archaeon]|nr:aconitase X catalytic domain-containing protein [Candidatus Diapherotrites archaeon]
MNLTKEEKEMLSGKHGNAVKKSMEILKALGEIYGAKKMISVSSVQIAGVSYDNLGEPGLEFLAEMAKDGKTRVLTTLNPAGMDMENWRALGIQEEFAEKQEKVINAFARMGVITTCTCTPYLIGNCPHFGEHIAWSESSAVAFANSVLGAYTNREGGPSALAAALTGKTPEYGMHLEKNRQAEVLVELEKPLRETQNFGALGKVVGEKIGNKIPLVVGQDKASLEELKSLSASIATYGGTAMFHMKGITPSKTKKPKEKILVKHSEIEEALAGLTAEGTSDFVSIGCPHASIKEIEKIAKLLEGKKVNKEVWITTARPTKKIADMMGYTKTIEEAGAKFAADTCCVVAPIKGRFNQITTDSAKGCFYAASKNKFKTRIKSIEECIKEACE